MIIDHLGYLTSNALKLYPDHPALIQEDLALTYRDWRTAYAGWLEG